jgi:hypothetical protein
MKITLTRAEGLTDECNKPFVCSTFTEANAKLSAWSRTAPEHGGYNKCDFKIEGPDEIPNYSGRYDLKHWRIECANLKGHVLRNLEFVAGQACPPSMTKERYDAFVAARSDHKDVAEELLEFYRDKR